MASVSGLSAGAESLSVSADHLAQPIAVRRQRGEQAVEGQAPASPPAATSCPAPSTRTAGPNAVPARQSSESAQPRTCAPACRKDQLAAAIESALTPAVRCGRAPPVQANAAGHPRRRGSAATRSRSTTQVAARDQAVEAAGELHRAPRRCRRAAGRRARCRAAGPSTASSSVSKPIEAVGGERRTASVPACGARPPERARAAGPRARASRRRRCRP